MMFPKPEKKEKVKNPIPKVKPKKVGEVIDYSGMAFAKPVHVKKQPKPIKARRKPNANVTINDKFCFFCGCLDGLEKHHIFYGTEKDASEEYGLKVWLCAEHHRGSKVGIHGGNIAADLELKQFGKEWFLVHYPNLDFLSIFGRNYLGVGDREV